MVPPTPAPLPHETLHVGVVLSVVGGFLDAYTYLLQGGVFANAQTGNVVLLAIALLDAPSLKFLKYLFPVGSFIAGIAVAEVLRSNRVLGSGRGWVIAVLALEALWLSAVGLGAGTLPQAAVNCGISLIAGLQVTAFKRLGNSPYATTMITGNLRSVIELLGQVRKDPRSWHQAAKYVAVIVGFAGGAALGAAACSAWRDQAVFLAVALLAAVMVAVSIHASSGRAS